MTEKELKEKNEELKANLKKAVQDYFNFLTSDEMEFASVSFAQEVIDSFVRHTLNS